MADPVSDLGPFAEPPLAGGLILVEGDTFSVCAPGGDMRAEAAEGLFVQDARVVSGWQLRLDGHRLEPLGGFTEEPFAGVYILRAEELGGDGEPTLVVERRRYVGAGMREDVTFVNHAPEPVAVRARLEVTADFADLFAVKLERARPPGPVTVTADGDRWRASAETAGGAREVTVRVSPGRAITSGLEVDLVLGAKERSTVTVGVEVAVTGREIRPRFPTDRPVEHAEPLQRSASWRAATPRVRSGSSVLQAVLARSEQDLTALRISDPTRPEISVVAAGAPWFMALFGRDSLITSWMSLGTDPDLALSTLRTLARFQGRTVDDATEEEPGRVLHELRFGTEPALALGGRDRYYGSVDSTPLFVFVLGELARWGAPPDAVESLLPAADAALAWVDRYGDRDGDGFVEYLAHAAGGLRNQGWKDSEDGINFADGRLAEPPIALVEVQGYVYAAFEGRAYLAELFGDPQGSREWRERAAELKARFNAAFWLPDRGHFAVGLDADKRPIDSLTSNVGQALWTGIVSDDLAEATAKALLSPALFSGYGVRTLAATMGAYNPASYHNGSVWPHDTALSVAGLARYGYRREAAQVAAGLIDAAISFAGRLPEVFCGFQRGALPGPVPYPTSCSPQAWASAAPLALLTAVLGVVPDAPARRLTIASAVPRPWRPLEVGWLHLGGDRVRVEVDGPGGVSVSAPAGLSVEVTPVGEETPQPG